MKSNVAQKENMFENIPFEKVLNCVHCGLCLESCPTYQELYTEQDSPRGRLYLMRGLWEGELELTENVMEPISRCLGCRACETACPSNVPYGDLLDKTRGVIARRRKQGVWLRFLRNFVFRHLLGSTFLLQMFSATALIYRWTGIPWLMTSTFLRRLLPARLVTAHRLMPQFSGRSFKRRFGKNVPLRADGARSRVALFTGCVMDVAEARIHQATLILLRAARCQIVIPQAQTCCGALPVHAGEREIARTLALRNEAAFSDLDLDAVIVNAAGCGAQLKEYGALFSDSPQADEARWSRFAAPVRDILDFLADIEGFMENATWRDQPATALYDAPCHLMHAQGIDAGPRGLLARVPGLELVPLVHADRCCGAAGIYNLVHDDLAGDILARKLDDIEACMAKHPAALFLVTANSGCLFQLRRGIQERGYPLLVLHPAELLAWCLSPQSLLVGRNKMTPVNV